MPSFLSFISYRSLYAHHSLSYTQFAYALHSFSGTIQVLVVQYTCMCANPSTQTVLYTHQNITFYKLENITASHFLFMIWIFFSVFSHFACRFRMFVVCAGPTQQQQHQQQLIYCFIIYINNIVSNSSSSNSISSGSGSSYKRRLCISEM